MKHRIKNRYIQFVGITVIVLALIRCVFPNVAEGNKDTIVEEDGEETDSVVLSSLKGWIEIDEAQDSLDHDDFVDSEEIVATPSVADYQVKGAADTTLTRYVADGEPRRRIKSVTSYSKCFPDSNHVQLSAARYWGVSPVKNRQDAEARKDELVYIGASPYYDLAKLTSSIPYLVPRASLLLQIIAQNFMDSLQVKGVPMCRIVVSSVLRTQDDVTRLRRSNKNATEQSCHLYATTFDINYNNFSPVADPKGPRRDLIQDVRLKQILSEVLYDLRSKGYCYVKYEVRQPCFHITVR